MLFRLRSKTPDFKGIGHWSYGCLIGAMGLIIYSFFPYPASVLVDLTFAILVNLFVLFGDILFLSGFRKFKNKPVQKYIFILLPLLSVSNSFVSTLVIHAPWLRMSINAIITVYLYAVLAIELYKSPCKALNSTFKFSSIIYAFYAFMQLIRAYIYFAIKPSDAVATSNIAIVLFAIAGVCVLILTINLLVIITTSLNEDLKNQIAHKNKLHTIIAHDLRNPVGDF